MSKTERQLAELIMDADLPKRLQDEIARLSAELAETKEALHYANGTCELAIQHRDAAEAAARRDAKEIARLREALKKIAGGGFPEADIASAALAPRPEGKGE